MRRKLAVCVLGVLLIWVAFVQLNHPLFAQTGCSRIYDPGNGWAVEMCTSDPAVTMPITFSSLAPPGFIFAAPSPLGTTWLDALHTDLDCVTYLPLVTAQWRQPWSWMR